MMHDGNVSLPRKDCPPPAPAAPTDAAKTLVAAPDLRVLSFTLAIDTVQASLSAPNGGIVLISIPHTPFWSAEIDGRPAALVSVNATQMAVAVPKGGERLSLRYHRPSLLEKLRSR